MCVCDKVEIESAKICEKRKISRAKNKRKISEICKEEKQIQEEEDRSAVYSVEEHKNIFCISTATSFAPQILSDE